MTVDAGPVAMCPVGELRRLLAGLAGRRVTLMGLGLFGGGRGAARFLAESGARLTVTDLRSAEKLAPSLDALADLSIDYHLGSHREEDFTSASLVVVSPAVPKDNPYLRSARRAGVPIASPMNMFLALCPAPVAAVTGSNGKSTTTALLATMLRARGYRTWLGGNIGISLLSSLPRIGPSDIVVLELSSFQLEDAAVLEWSPHVAIVTNITPNHLDRHGTMEAYADAKRNILRFQGADDFAVLNARNDLLCGWVHEGLRGRPVWVDSRPRGGGLPDGVSLISDRLVWRAGPRHDVLCAREDIPLLGMHNVENVMAAAAGACCLGAGADAVRTALSTFVGLEHRLELVGEFRGMRFYNDSDSTTPDSSVAAVRSFSGPVTLIAGGYDKKLDLSPMAHEAAVGAEALITMGQTGPAIAQRAREESALSGRSLLVREVGTLQEAVDAAAELSMPGTTVLFSPGCASYDMFENCDQRGETFKHLVRTRFGGPGRRRRRA
jgi:UDP-N-acetylmuramoylalanine--D-glutamate ligase